MTFSDSPFSHTKSGFTRLLDFIRNIFIVLLTIYFVYLLWHWNWIVAIISAIPIYIITINLVGFITIPIYSFSPENRLLKKGFKAAHKHNFEEFHQINEEFEDKFKSKNR